MRAMCIRVFAGAILTAALAVAAAANTLTVTSVPSGATVEINGLVVGNVTNLSTASPVPYKNAHDVALGNLQYDQGPCNGGVYSCFVETYS